MILLSLLHYCSPTVFESEVISNSTDEDGSVRDALNPPDEGSNGSAVAQQKKTS